MTVLPRLADIVPDRLLAELVRAELTGPGGTRRPPDLLAALGAGDDVSAGYWLVREVSGAGEVDDRFAQAVAVQVDAWAQHADPAQARADARRLCTLVLMALRLGQMAQTATAYGSLAAWRVDTWPAEVPETDRPTGLSRYVAAGSAIVRPPR